MVRRDLLIGIADAIAREDAPALFELAGRAVESGYDLRLVVRELSRLTRDLLVLTIDPSRVSDPEIAADAERQALLDLSRRFSGEDLMRAFDVLTKAEYEIRSSMQPRYHLEMALLRWLHLRKLVPLTDLIEQMRSGGPALAPVAQRRGSASPSDSAPARLPVGSSRVSPSPVDSPPVGSSPVGPSPVGPTFRSGASPQPARSTTVQAVEAKRAAPPARAAAPPKAGSAVESGDAGPNLKPVDASILKDSFLSEIRKAKKFFYGTVVAQAQRIDFEGDKVVFVFGPQHRALRAQLEPNRPWLEAAASQLAARKMSVTAAEGTAAPGSPASSMPTAAGDTEPVPDSGDQKQSLKERALSDTGVQTMLDVFAAEIKDVEEM